MSRQELERRLQNLAEQFVDRFEIAEIHTGDLQVELTLKPHTPITERFIALLETALHQRIGSLSFFRVRRNVFMIRFTLQRSNDDSAADRIEEFPTPYASVGYKLGCIAHANEIRRQTLSVSSVSSGEKRAGFMTIRPTQSFQVFGPTRSGDGRRGGSSH